MSGFLSSLFSQKTKETAPAPKTLEERLLDVGVTEEGAKHFAEVIENGGEFVFDARKEAHFPHRNIAINALDCLLKAADGKTFKSFILVSLNNKICSEDPSKITVTRKMPDGTLVKQKAEPGMIRPYDLSLLTEGKINVSTDCFGVKKCLLEDNEAAGLAGFMEKTAPSELDFREVDINPFIKNASKGLDEGKITRFSADFCELSEENKHDLALSMERSNLTLFHMQMLNKGVGKPLTCLIEALPPSVTDLSLDDNMFTDDEKKALIKKLPDLKALRRLSLESCEIRTWDIKKMAAALPPSLETVSLKGNSQIMDEGTTALIHAMETKNRLLHKTALFKDEWGDVGLTGNSVRAQMAKTETENKNFYMEKAQRDKAEKIAYLQSGKTVEEKLNEAKSPEEVKGLIFETYAFGNVGDALKRMQELKATFTPEDLSKENKDGLRVIDVLSVSRKIPDLISDKLIAGTKNLTAAFNMLCDTDKKLFDGQNGRPTFAKVKNDVMAAAVKQTIAAKRFERKGM